LGFHRQSEEFAVGSDFAAKCFQGWLAKGAAPAMTGRSGSMKGSNLLNSKDFK